MRRGNIIAAVVLVAIDYMVYRVMFIVGLISVWSVISVIGTRWFGATTDWSIGYYFVLTFETSLTNTPVVSDHSSFIFFWAGLAPSIWMWLYVAALFVTRGLLRSERIVTWLRWALDIEKAPFRSIGAVAATLALIGSVAIILVSVEVSRISGA